MDPSAAIEAVKVISRVLGVDARVEKLAKLAEEKARLEKEMAELRREEMARDSRFSLYV